jgi:hypothetical protein
MDPGKNPVSIIKELRISIPLRLEWPIAVPPSAPTAFRGSPQVFTDLIRTLREAAGYLGSESWTA